MEKTKKCSKCGEEKPLSEFYKKKDRKYGVFSWCKKCSKERVKEWYYNNRAKSLEYHKEYREKNKDSIRQWQKGYKSENRERLKKYNQEYRKLNEDIIKKNRKLYRISHVEHIRIKKREESRMGVRELSDRYIIYILKYHGYNKDSITHDLIKFKRADILLQRKIKEIKKWTTNNL